MNIHPAAGRESTSRQLVFSAPVAIQLVMIGLLIAGQFRPAQAKTFTLQDDEAGLRAEELLARMTPEEKVGQLFLIAFDGTDIGPNTPVFDLITRYNISGVILSAENNNIPGPNPETGSTPQQVYNLIRQLQINRWTASQTSQDDPIEEQGSLPSYIPLFIGLSQEGDGYRFDQLLSGLVTLPNEMAIGASWNPELSYDVAETVGQQMSTLGVNLLLGPSLDVLETQLIPGANELGTRSFGGDPYWVSTLGQAYIQGIHSGSDGRVAVIAKHFPGLGSSDRATEDEIPTIRKTLEELKSIELSPFFAVTGGAPDSQAAADGLLASHIRYQGLQGNIRSTTRPITFDQQAMNLVLQLPQIESWRANGGVVVSDDLGSPAVREFYELTDQRFDITRRVALEAFLAGNDLLYVSDFSSGTANSYDSAVKTLDFFAQKYNEDFAFAQRVDEAVLRILTLKYRLYGDFFLYDVLPDENMLATLKTPSTVPFDVAQQSATLISPSQVELEESLPNPPGQNDRLVILTDTRTGQQCSTCEAFPLIPQDSMQSIIQRRYGPEGTGQIQPENLKSYSLADLETMLNTSQGGQATRVSQQLERDLQNTEWIVFNMLDADPSVPSYVTLSRFLSERLDLIQNKRLIVFAFNAPYFLDETDISKLTAYYGLYSKTQDFIDVATYLLFQDNIQPVGSLPVSVPGINYDVNDALFPNGEQVIPLTVSLVSTATSQRPTQLPPGQQPEVQVGDTIQVQTGVIFDNNNRPVPDGTPVEFLFSIGGEANPVLQTAITKDGIAAVEYTIRDGGTLVIRASSQTAQSEYVVLTIPFPPGSLAATPTSTSEEPTTEETAEPTPAPAIIANPETPGNIYPDIGQWAWAVLITAVISWLAYRAYLSVKMGRWGVRAALLAVIGGLLGFSYLAVQLPGSEQILQNEDLSTVILVSIGGALAGLAIAFTWQQLDKTRRKKTG